MSLQITPYYSTTLLCRACSGTVNYCLPLLSVSHEPREFTSLSARISCQNVDIAFRWSALGSSSVSWLPHYHSVHYFIFASVAVPSKLKSSNLDDARYRWQISIELPIRKMLTPWNIECGPEEPCICAIYPLWKCVRHCPALRAIE